MPDPDAITRLRRDRLLGANLTGCDVNFCWMIQIQKKGRADQSESIVFAWPGHKKVFVYSTNLNFEENGRRVELRGNFQTPIFAFTEEKHTFLKRLMERRTT